MFSKTSLALVSADFVGSAEIAGHGVAGLDSECLDNGGRILPSASRASLACKHQKSTCIQSYVIFDSNMKLP